MQRASLIAAVALLLLSVRGKLGVEIWTQCLTLPRLRLLATDRLTVFFKNFYKAVTQLMRKKGLLHKDVSHNEGRTHRTSGLNPLSACAKSSEARKHFLGVVQAWTPIFERVLCRGYRVQTADLLELRDATLGFSNVAKYIIGSGVVPCMPRVLASFYFKSSEELLQSFQLTFMKC